MKASYVISCGILVVGLVGCSSNSSGVDTGVLVVQSNASGQNIPLLSLLQIQGLPDDSIVTDGGEFVTGLISVGPRQVGLLVADNCDVADPNPRTVDVDSRSTTTTFVTTCS